MNIQFIELSTDRGFVQVGERRVPAVIEEHFYTIPLGETGWIMSVDPQDMWAIVQNIQDEETHVSIDLSETSEQKFLALIELVPMLPVSYTAAKQIYNFLKEES